MKTRKIGHGDEAQAMYIRRLRLRSEEEVWVGGVAAGSFGKEEVRCEENKWRSPLKTRPNLPAFHVANPRRS